ncbi:Clp1-domain-containing protein [Coemansia reversa NRRL 1564]|uniref:Polynucleotide 5'-hydroxyl-kinase GRC3 n=1 Tax=Coemansia reversa (strain ATCC 12441 / NRRL 1564) TaxID=763665 RepID=A0A2G5B6F2_COERN|nr:Clp1-domain-containing protein [Coemansia reversa NRRL 1564]|eukprot:PIA14574.1 Clp1-domain-containing protein [Coemansia reversa NRRL 1564]
MSTKEWELGPGSEFRFEVDFKKTIKVRLLSGQAEYFGTELGPEAEYQFSGGENGAIFSWNGCKISVTGECSSAYVADETAMDAYINVHVALQQQRAAAHVSNHSGPRVMIVGPEDCGKTALARILLTYAARQGERPLFVDLDPRDASVSVPGTLSVAAVSQAVDIEAGFMGLVQPSSQGAGETPLVWQFGYEQPDANPALFNALVDCAASAVTRRQKTDGAASGLIVDTRGFSDVARDQTIDHAVQALRITALLVVGNERMHSVLAARFGASDSTKSESVTVLKIPRSGGAVDRSPAMRQQLGARAVQRYFYGAGRERVTSFSTVVPFDDLCILRVGVDAVAPSSTLPLGETRKLSGTSVSPVVPDESLAHSVLAVTSAPAPDDAEAAANVDAVGLQVVGFVNVTKVDMEKRRLIVLSPVPGRLPKQVLLYGNTRWMETV